MLLVYLLVTVLAVSSLAQSSPDSDRDELRAELELVGCDLRNDTIKQQFQAAVRGRHGVDPNYAATTYHLILAEEYYPPVECKDRCDNSCSRTDGVTWCINMYHPSELIEMCLNLTSGEINGTDYAWRLGLNEFIEQQTTPPQDSNLLVTRPLPFLTNAVLTFNVRSLDCNATTFRELNIYENNEDSRPPMVRIRGSNELRLGERNTILCIAEFYDELTEGRPEDAYCHWHLNGTTSDNQNPDADCDSFDDANLSCFENVHRVDFVSWEYLYVTCPRRRYVIHSWIVIDNATEADTEVTYECRASYLSKNPVLHYLRKNVEYPLVPVYPSVNIITLETPTLPPGHTDGGGPEESPPTFFLGADEQLQWSCSVVAGVEDRLAWTFNGVEIPSSKEHLNCSLATSDVFVVSREAVDRGNYERQLQSTLIICQATEVTAGLYECVVNRSTESGVSVTRVWSANVLLKRETAVDSRFIIVGVSIGCSTALIVLIVAAALLICCTRIRHKRRQQQREKDWTRDIFMTEDVLHMKCISPVAKSPASSLVLQQVDPLEFPRSKLVFMNTILGKGTFGVVLQARAEDIVKFTPQRNIVAVKTPRSKAPPHEIDNFWEELQLMKHILPHSNIVNLLGYCTTPGEPIYMIIEYARYGSLKNFLKECEQIVLQLNHLPQVFYKSRHCSTSDSSSSAYPQLVDKMQLCAQNSVFTPDCTSTPTTATGSGAFQFPPAKTLAMTRERLTTQDSGFYGDHMDLSPQVSSNDGAATVAHTIAPLTHDYVNSKGLLYMEDIQNFALQIACGLKHLEECQIVHCDLAARNILIAEGFVLKIGDFGMARDVSEKEYYRKQGGQIPVKWTAPEALKDQIFTYKSDIWSFGVVLWEILTYGQQPYPKLKVRHSWESFIKYLMEGNRLPQPKGCPDNFYDLMLSCWRTSPDQRPTAEDLVHLLSQKNLLLMNDTGLESTVDDSPSLDKNLYTTDVSLSPQYPA